MARSLHGRQIVMGSNTPPRDTRHREGEKLRAEVARERFKRIDARLQVPVMTVAAEWAADLAGCCSPTASVGVWAGVVISCVIWQWWERSMWGGRSERGAVANR